MTKLKMRCIRRVPSEIVLAGLVVLFFCMLLVAQVQAAVGSPGPARVAKGAKVLGPFQPTLFKGDLRKLPKKRAWQPGEPIKTIPKRNNHQGKQEAVRPPANPLKHRIDPLIRRDQGARAAATVRTLKDSVRYAGQGFTGVYPPDPVGDVGENYYIQMINGSQMTIHLVMNGK